MIVQAAKNLKHPVHRLTQQHESINCNYPYNRSYIRIVGAATAHSREEHQRRKMSKKTLTTFIVLLFTSGLFSQDFSISKKKLKPAEIDTATNKTFIYELQDVRLYFRQQDILEYLQDPKHKSILGSVSYDRLLDTLRSEMKVITVRDIPDHTNDAEFDSLLSIYDDSITLQQLNSQFYFIGAVLMLNGKFMLYSNLENKFIKKGMFAKKRRGLFGHRTLNFYIPKRQQFYYITTSLGE